MPEEPARPLSLRERRRAAATREILDAAMAHISEHGPAALSLRAVARDLGMTVQALYHYFPNRDALVTAVMTEAYESLADAVATAAATRPAGPATPGLVAVAEGYRDWALAHPELFRLLYGTPIRHYAAPADGPTTEAVRRMSAVFERELFADLSAARLAAADTPPLSPALSAYLGHIAPEALGGLPPAASTLLLSAWGHLHGLVVLEVFGHLGFMGEHQAEVFRLSMRNLLADVRRRVGAEPGAI